MVGYEINLGYIFNKINSSKTRNITINENTSFKVPSIKFNTYLKPSNPGTIIYKVPKDTKEDQDKIKNASGSSITNIDEAVSLLGAEKLELQKNNFSELNISKIVNDKSLVESFSFEVTYNNDSKGIKMDKFIVSFMPIKIINFFLNLKV